MIVFNFKSHLIFAILLFLLASKYTMLPLGLVGLIGCLLAFSLPDIDHENSKISRKLPIISWFVTLICRHRGITHSLLTMMVIFILSKFLLINEAFVNGFLIGYGSHLLGDMFTPRGIPLFYPLGSYYRIPILCNLGIATQIMLVLAMGYFIIVDTNFQNFFIKLFTIN